MKSITIETTKKYLSEVIFDTDKNDELFVRFDTMKIWICRKIYIYENIPQVL